MLTMMKAENLSVHNNCLDGMHQIPDVDAQSMARAWSANRTSGAAGQQSNQHLSSANPQINVVAGQSMVQQHPHQESHQQIMQPQQQQTNDVINLQYIELEEFLLENAVAAVQQQHSQHSQHEHIESKVLCDSSPSPSGSICQDSPGGSSSSEGINHSEKHYQISLEQRQLLTPQHPPQFGWPSPPHHQQAHSPVQQQQQQQADLQQANLAMGQHNINMPTTTARKSFPRRISTCSSTSALSVSPPPQSSTPQMLSPPLSSSSPLMTAHLLETSSRDLKTKKAVKRSRKETVPDDSKDDKYWKRRAKNNEAAKRSRDLRREKESHILQRVAFLERENQLLNQELNSIKQENDEFRKRLSHYEAI